MCDGYKPSHFFSFSYQEEIQWFDLGYLPLGRTSIALSAALGLIAYRIMITRAVTTK